MTEIIKLDVGGCVCKGPTSAESQCLEPFSYWGSIGIGDFFEGVGQAVENDPGGVGVRGSKKGDHSSRQWLALTK